MPAPPDLVDQLASGSGPPSDFTERLELSLGAADAERRRVQVRRRMQSLLPIVLLVGPVVAWRLMEISPSSAHVAIDTLAWISYVLVVAVHVDNSVLTYLGLKVLPTIVGILLLLLITGWLLCMPRGEE